MLDFERDVLDFSDDVVVWQEQDTVRMSAIAWVLAGQRISPKPLADPDDQTVSPSASQSVWTISIGSCLRI